MTPKEKAKELIDEYVDIMPPIENQTGKSIIKHAKQCAIIAVDAILSILNENCINDGYWDEVKEELNKSN